jgi:hypothetical protein
MLKRMPALSTVPRRGYRLIAQLTTNGAKHLSLQKALWRGVPDAYDSHGPTVLTPGRPANCLSSYWTVRTPSANCQGAVSNGKTKTFAWVNRGRRRKARQLAPYSFESGRCSPPADGLAWSARLVCQDARDECSRRDPQHEGGRSNAFDVTYTQMRHNRAHKVEDEADARRDAQGRPPDAKN